MGEDAGQIDPELRKAAGLLKLLTRPYAWLFRSLRWVDRKREGRSPDGVRLKQVRITRDSGRHRIRVCIFRPGDIPPGTPLAPVLYIHGGGYAMGNPETAGEIISQLIQTRPCVVIAPDYTKSLDAPYPAAIDDCYKTLLWADRNRAGIGATCDDFAIIGHSAGGGLTAAVTLRVRDRGGPGIAFQMPIYPMIDDRTTPSSAENRAPVWNSKSNKLGWSLYLGELEPGSDTVPSDAAPAREVDHTNLPPTASYVGELDPFRDETIAFVRSIEATGIPAKLLVAPGAFHASEILVPKARVSREANMYILDTFAEGMDRNFQEWSTGVPGSGQIEQAMRMTKGPATS